MSTTAQPDAPFVAGSLAGKPVRRVEDPRFLTGRGTYVDNQRFEGELRAVFVRSPFAHATITSIDTSEAETMPGVVAVYTADTLDVPAWTGMMQLHPAVSRPPLARGAVQFVGDTVAVVIAESYTAGVDAAELVIVEYEPLPAAVGMEDALAEGAPVQHEDVARNLVTGSRDELGAAVLDGADVVVRGRFENQRLAIVPMEPGAIVAVPGDADHDLIVHLACQMPHGARGQLSGLFGLPQDRIRVIAPDVGGAFGAKHLCAEGVVAVAAARELGRPVRWVETRSENMVSMPHGRGQVQYIELGLTSEGVITGLRCRIVGDAGAYAGFGGFLPGNMTRMMASGVYRVPAVSYDVAVALTNTTPMGAYRGAGRPEAAAFVERIMDMAAVELDLDPAELRRRNLIQPDELPRTTVMGARYDSGDYPAALQAALDAAGYDELRAEQAERRRRGDRVQLGIGLSTYVEVTGSGGSEYATVTVGADGRVRVSAGTSGHGQGHATAFAMLVADRLRVPMDRIDYVQSDTALVARGGGTGGSRSLQLGGTAVAESAVAVADRGKEIAAELLEAAVEDVVLGDEGEFFVAGVPARSLDWAAIAQSVEERGERLEVAHDSKQDGPTFPFGAHVSVVEVDLDTGQVTPRRHIAVDDCGRILNPLLADGQVHGGVASGISQALWEEMVYDEDGNPLTATLAEYGMPSAAELISYEVSHTEIPSPLNVIGAKGIGESGTVGSTPAVQNAVVDAVAHLGIRHLDMPLTSERVWRAVAAAEEGTLADPWREPPDIFATLPVTGGPSEAEEEEVNL